MKTDSPNHKIFHNNDILRYIFGEMPDSEAQRFEAALDSQPRLAQQYDELVSALTLVVMQNPKLDSNFFCIDASGKLAALESLVTHKAGLVWV